MRATTAFTPVMDDASPVDELTAERLREERVIGIGTVKYLSSVDGYGVISPDEGDDDLCFQVSSVRGDSATLATGARVVFEVRPGHNGLEAFDVVTTQPARPGRSPRPRHPVAAGQAHGRRLDRLGLLRAPARPRESTPR